jgi:molybdopterin-containing oxidoreductase family membrane subunit
LFGEYWWVFWVVHIGLGTLIPLLLLTFRSQSVAAVGLAGLLIAVTFMAVRVNLVVPGLAEPNLLGLEQAYVHPRLSFEYVPSLFEWQVTLFISSCGIAAMFLGLKLLPLTTSPEPQAASGSGVSLGIKM